MKDLICIIGTDGSGKTTLADTFVAALSNRGRKAERVWLGSDSYLMFPVRAVLRWAWAARKGKWTAANGPKLGAASQRVDYAAEIARKNVLAARYGWAVRIYLVLVWLDYVLQLRVKAWRYRNVGTIVADRYLFDVAVNLGLTLGWSPDDVVRYVQTKIARVTLPQIRVFLRVEPEVSIARKDDVFDIEYLRMRLEYYDGIATAFGFTVRDGTLPIDANVEWLLTEVEHDAARPYVIYVHSNNVDVGGADKVLALMARHMRDHNRPHSGCRVAVALRLSTSILRSHEEAGVPVILHPFERPQLSHGVAGLLRLALRAPSSLWFFWRLFGRERPDIVHVNDLYDFLPAFAANLRGIPVVWHIRMIVSRPYLRQIFATLLARLAVVSISVSKAVRNNYFPTPRDGHQALVIHDLGNSDLTSNDADPSVATAHPAWKNRNLPLVVMVGRIEPWKGQHIFVEAVAALPTEVREKAVFALIGGSVQSKEDYFNKIKASAVSAGITMLGERDDVPAILRAADISVHASVAPDPFPGVVIESLLAGAATIASAEGGAVEMIEDNKNGLLNAPGDVNGLTIALLDLLSADVLPRKRFGIPARARAMQLVDAKVVDNKVDDVYRSIMSGKM